MPHCKQNTSDADRFDEMERKTLEDKIVWSKSRKLQWKDFVYIPNEKAFKIYAKVGLSTRYNVNPPIQYRSKTTFSPTESIVSDTTNGNDLRVAQLKFDLLETYRRRMENEVDSLRVLKLTDLRTSDLDELVNRYYKNFESEWNSYKNTFSVSKLDSLQGIINSIVE